MSENNYTIEIISSSPNIVEIQKLEAPSIQFDRSEPRYSYDILNFDDAVSGLILVKNLSPGSGISVVNNSGNFLIAVTGQFGLNSEQVDDRVSSLLNSGDYIFLQYDDQSNTLTISATGLMPSGNYSIVGHSHSISDIIDLQNQLNNKQPSGSYAISNHSHVVSDITNFNSSISGLLPVKNISSGSGINVTNNSGEFTVSVTGQFGLTSEQVDDRISSLLQAGSYVNINYEDNLDQLTINVTGLQPSGNYSIVGHTHNISDINNLQNELNNKQPSGIYASGTHYHVVNDITNFETSVSGLIFGIYAPLISPNFSGIPTVPTANSGTNNSQIANTEFVRNEISSLVNSAPTTLDTLNELALALGNDPNFATTIASGLGQKANLVHTHNTSDITNFNSSVSGLLPITSISGGTNISIVPSGTIFTINASGLQPSGNYSLVGHTHTSSDITDFNSSTSGIINSTLSTAISGGIGIDVSYYSNTDTLLISTSGVSLVGHQHTYSEITDFNTGVRLNRINDLTVPSGNVSFNNYRLTNLATPTSGTDAVTKSYIDTLYASTSGLGISSFSSGDFSVVSGIVSVKNSGIDNNQLYYSYITLGTSTINLGSSVNSISGLVLDGGTP
jgi:hypothetical protein